MLKRSLLALVAALPAWPAWAASGPLTIVAAENFYGDLARQLAGPDAAVTSVMSNPDQDPHLFEASPSIARALSSASLVIYNGADYDPWMAKLLGSTPTADRRVIVVADLVGKKPGDNPHLWYDTATMATAARAIAAALASADPAHAQEGEQRLRGFTDTLAQVDMKVAAMRARHAGAPVTATEPVFGYMAAALGLQMHNERFQLAVMNNTEPRASDVAAFETDLRGHRVRALLYNSQASNTAARRMLRLARQAAIPVVGVTETEPAGTVYHAWMLSQLDALDTALSRPR